MSTLPRRRYFLMVEAVFAGSADGQREHRIDVDASAHDLNGIDITRLWSATDDHVEQGQNVVELGPFIRYRLMPFLTDLEPIANQMLDAMFGLPVLASSGIEALCVRLAIAFEIGGWQAAEWPVRHDLVVSELDIPGTVYFRVGGGEPFSGRLSIHGGPLTTIHDGAVVAATDDPLTVRQRSAAAAVLTPLAEELVALLPARQRATSDNR